MNHDHPHERRRRARIAGGIVAACLGVLGLASFRLQVVGSDQWVLQSESNRLRPLPLPPPRGTLFDRNDNILAESVPGYEVTLLPGPADSMHAVLRRIAPYLELSEPRIESLMNTVRRYPRQPLLVERDASFDAVAALEERRAMFPSVFIDMRPKRRYPAGAATAHVLGYVGEINQNELDRPEFDGYEPRMIVGKEGIERAYERRLQGQYGVRYVEVDAAGRIVGSFRGYQEESAVPGGALTLNLDLDLMEWIHRIFPDSMRGAVVALDVESGGVLALYSAPSFDANQLVGTVDRDEWNALNGDPNRPLYNRATQGLYAPASTFKLATAAVGLELGLVTPEEFMPEPCRGGYRFGRGYFRCHKRDGHGYLDMAGAIANSCDVYFYQLGIRIGLQRFLDDVGKLGFRSECGVDLPTEGEGEIPAEFSWWERRFGYRPTEGEVISLSIGQGPNRQTPIKMAQFYLAIARRGEAPAPRIVQGEPAPEGLRLDIAPETIESLWAGLRRVMDPGGTGHMSSLEHWDLWGKSGTGQNETGRDHAWFAGFGGPLGGDPEIVVVVLVEQGESGSGTAAPIMAKTIDYYLRRKHDIPVDTIQTLREHYRVGRPAPWVRRWSEGG
ncbi:MAG: penicillin-binding protein 2 [Gemmatimonadota bacterium]|nr:penicillin-binding protein 2 [Gemmatimonadota bacterium]